MSAFAPPIQHLVTELSKLPGIGARTAQRLAFHILRSSDEDALGLADAIREVKERVGLCEVCFNLADEPRCRICNDERRDRSLICVVEEPGDVIPIERTHEYRGVYHVLGGALSPIDGIDPEDLKIDELYARVTSSQPAVGPADERSAEMGSGGDRGDPGRGSDGARGDPDRGSDGDRGESGMGSGGDRGEPRMDSVGERGEPAGGLPVREVVLATNPTTTGEATALHIAAELRRRAPDVTVTRLASGLPVGADLEYADEITLGKALVGRRSL